MLNSNVVEVAIGLVFCYASVALMSSSVFEAIANWLNLRSQNLFKGIRQLLNADQSSVGQKLLLSIYNHALSHPMGCGSANELKELKRKPSYIAAEDFASVVMANTLRKQNAAPSDALTEMTQASLADNSQLKAMVDHLIEKSSGDMARVEKELARWFDASMEEVAIAYKRNSQLWCFIIALAITIIFNLDSVQLFKNLWLQPNLVAQINIGTDSVAAQQAYDQLLQLPVGWQENSLENLKSTWFVGWLVTASASLVGAPFWFELLKNIARLRTPPKKSAT